VRGGAPRGARLCVWALVLGALAGTAQADSVYDLPFLGRRVVTGDVGATALGGPVQMVEDSLGALQSNPAMLSLAKRMTFGVAQYFSGDYDDSANLSRADMSYRLSSFIFAFPLHRHVSVGAGFRARYDAAGGFATPMQTSEGAGYYELFRRSGGLSSIPFQFATDVLPLIDVGGFFALERGTIENNWTFDFLSRDIRDASSVQRREFEGTSWGAGAVLRPVGAVALGAHYESRVEYDTEVRELHTNDLANRSYRETTILPARWTASLRVRIGQRNAVYAGASRADFTEFRGLAFPIERLRAEEIVALGYERRRVMGGLPLRLSATYERMPYTLPGGEELRRIGGTIGTGLSLGRGKGKIDLALEFARTGSVGTNGYENRLFRFYVGIGGGETWRGKQVDE